MPTTHSMRMLIQGSGLAGLAANVLVIATGAPARWLGLDSKAPLRAEGLSARQAMAAAGTRCMAGLDAERFLAETRLRRSSKITT